MLFVILIAFRFVACALDKMNQTNGHQDQNKTAIMIVPRLHENTLAMNPRQNLWGGSLAFTRERTEMIRYESDPIQKTSSLSKQDQN